MEQKQIESFEEAVSYLGQVPKFTQKNEPADTKAFLELLGHPEQSMNIIHVAGTNGKGSVCAYLRSILTEAGYHTCLFTSPHLVDMRERFQIDGEMVGQELFLWAFLEVYNRLDHEKVRCGEGYHPTFFEYLFFMAMLIFRAEQTDYVILETGLGGRLDTTNVVEHPLITVITKIGLDHMEYLGNSIADIAVEKAGIIKQGVPVVYDDSVPEASKVIEDYARKAGSRTYSVSNRDYTLMKFHHKNIDFSYHSRYYDYIGLTLSTVALYQMENAAVALRTIEVMDEGRTIKREHMTEGIRKAVWEGRMEEVLPDIYVDGAHNEDGIHAFLRTVEADQCAGRRHIMFSAVRDKSYECMIPLLMESGLFETVTVTCLQDARTISIQELRRVLEPYQRGQICFYEDAGKAFQITREKQKQRDKVYIVGSLYLVGEIKAILGRNRVND